MVMLPPDDDPPPNNQFTSSPLRTKKTREIQQLAIEKDAMRREQLKYEVDSILSSGRIGDDKVAAIADLILEKERAARLEFLREAAAGCPHCRGNGYTLRRNNTDERDDCPYCRTFRAELERKP